MHSDPIIRGLEFLGAVPKQDTSSTSDSGAVVNSSTYQEETTMYFVIYLDNRSEWRFLLRRQGNHETIAVSSEGYVQKSSCQYAMDLVKSAYNAPVYEQGTDGKLYAA